MNSSREDRLNALDGVLTSYESISVSELEKLSREQLNMNFQDFWTSMHDYLNSGAVEVNTVLGEQRITRNRELNYDNLEDLDLYNYDPIEIVLTRQYDRDETPTFSLNVLEEHFNDYNFETYKIEPELDWDILQANKEEGEITESFQIMNNNYRSQDRVRMRLDIEAPLNEELRPSIEKSAKRYANTHYKNRIGSIAERLDLIDDAAEEAYEYIEELAEENGNTKEEILEREIEKMSPEDYYTGEGGGSTIIKPYSEAVETSPENEGLMPLSESRPGRRVYLEEFVSRLRSKV